MILKSYEIKKIDHSVNHLILFYGKNEGLKNEVINILINDKKKISNFEENNYEKSTKQSFASSITNKLISELLTN